MNTHPASAQSAQAAPARSPRGAGEEFARTTPAGDIHDIRMLTATGPIELPTPVRVQQESRKAG